MPCPTIIIWFQVLLIFGEEFFSTFAHATCFAIRLSMYLELGVDVACLSTAYPGSSTLRLESTFKPSSTRVSRFIPAHSSALRVSQLSCTQTSHLYYVSTTDSNCSFPFSIAFTHGIAFAFFSSPYLDASIQEVPYPFGSLAETSMRSHSAIFGSKAACASPKLIATCYDLPRQLS